MNKNILINSSFFITFLTFLGWSVAYVYGWAKSYYYDYPWELVEVGIDNIARGLGYILFLSIMISFFYIVGLTLINIIKSRLPITITSSIRTFVVLAIIFTPVLVQISLFMQKTSYIVILTYLAFAIPISILCKRKDYNININQLVNIVTQGKVNLSIMLFTIYLYFVLSALMVGYYRQFFRNSYPEIQIGQTEYYILAKSNNTLVLTKNLSRENNVFFVYPCFHKKEPCRIEIVDYKNINKQ